MTRDEFITICERDGWDAAISAVEAINDYVATLCRIYRNASIGHADPDDGLCYVIREFCIDRLKEYLQ